MDTEKINILIVGATGKLGGLITKYALLQPSLNVNILVSKPASCPELVTKVQKAGGKVLQGDLCQTENFKNFTKGMHTVISTVYPMDEVTLKGQMALIDDCVRNGVKRFVPSDFVGKIDNSREELKEIFAVESKIKINDYLNGKPIKTLHFWQGIFMECFFELLSKQVGYWGNSEHKYDLTSYEDTAKVVAAAVADENKTGDIVIVAESLTIQEVADIYSRVKGFEIIPQRFGSLEDLKARWKAAKNADNTSYLTYLLSILVYIHDDRCKLEKNNNNEFPWIKLTTVEDFLRKNPQIRLR